MVYLIIAIIGLITIAYIFSHKEDNTIVSFCFNVVGIGFEQNTKNACATATDIFLQKENNPYDKNAIAVL